MTSRMPCLAVLAIVLALCGLSEPVHALEIIKGPYLQNVTMQGITVMWETDLPSDSRVDYGESEQYGRIKESGDAVTLHEIVIGDLWTDSLFHYTVTSTAGADRVESTDSTFQTAVAPGTPFTFCAYGDGRGQPSVHEPICDLMRSKSPRFVLNSGDLVSEGYNYEEWQAYFFYPARELLRQVAMFTIPGNHERQHDYYTYFMSNPTDSSGTEWYYSFDFGDVHFCMINTCDTEYGHGNDMTYYPGTPQYEWIVNDLASADKEWKIVMLHHPPYSSGTHGCGEVYKVREYLHPLFIEHDVDLVIAGHEHLYERTVSMRGVPYVVSGGGGAWLSSETCDHWWTVKLVVDYNYCIISIDGLDLSMEVRDIGDQVIDTLRLSHSRIQPPQEHRKQVAPNPPIH